MYIEILESRIAPASVFHYTDVDGDKVTIKSSKGDLNFPGVVNLTGGQLQLLDISTSGFDGANITFTVQKVGGGDGLASVGYISATGEDLGNVTIKGDLGHIDAGSGTPGKFAIKSLTTYSMGLLGLGTQGNTGNLTSTLAGALGALQVTTDFKDASLIVNGSTSGTIGSVTIGGSLIGGSADYSGSIKSHGDMGTVKIGHDIQGGAGLYAGMITSLGKLTSLTVGGSLIGGYSIGGSIFITGDIGMINIHHDVLGGGYSSGQIVSNGNMEKVIIGGSVIGGSSGLDSGAIQSTGKLGSITIGGSLVGGSVFTGFIYGGKIGTVTIHGSLNGGGSNSSGFITSDGNIGSVKIDHNLTGGSIGYSDSLNESGEIVSTGRIGSITIGGSIISGIDNSSGSLSNNATIRAGDDMGSLTIKGSILGNTTPNGLSPVVISARGQAVQGATTDVAIGKIAVGGTVEYANILAGYTTTLVATNGDAQIGAVNIGGNWIASNLVAGAQNTASNNVKFGDANDTSIGTGNVNIVARIASVIIKGQVLGTPDSTSSTDHFGIVADYFGNIKISGSLLPIGNKPQPVGQTGDFGVDLLSY